VLIELLGDELDESEVELLWDLGGQTALYFGDLCYNGARSEAIKIIELLDKRDILGDEYSIVDIKNFEGNGIKYHIFDGPNESIAMTVVVYPCE
jgi:hypothetical protein